jgi:hypothetical protein
MKRLALVLAAGAFGTGCYAPPPCSPSASIDWRYDPGSATGGFLPATGPVLQTCAAAGVASVAVRVNGAIVGTFACDLGAPAVVPLVDGVNDVSVEGRDVAGTILFRHRFPITTSSCDSQGAFVAQPGEGTVSLAYSFFPTNVCYQLAQSYIWIRVWDDLAGVIAADSSSDPIANACGSANPFTFRLAEGSYTLLSTEEVIVASPYAPVGTDCGHAGIDVVATQTTPVSPSPVLTDSVTWCP